MPEQKKDEVKPAKTEPATPSGPGMRVQEGAPTPGKNDPPSKDAPGGTVDGVKNPAI